MHLSPSRALLTDTVSTQGANSSIPGRSQLPLHRRGQRCSSRSRRSAAYGLEGWWARACRGVQGHGWRTSGQKNQTTLRFRVSSSSRNRVCSLESSYSTPIHIGPWRTGCVSAFRAEGDPFDKGRGHSDLGFHNFLELCLCKGGRLEVDYERNQNIGT